jgi:hypothetical protein
MKPYHSAIWRISISPTYEGPSASSWTFRKRAPRAIASALEAAWMIA